MTEPLFSDDDEEFDRPRLAAHGPVRVRVPAKINLHLHVGPARADGFHELTTVYHAIGLYDEITARRGDTLTLTMEGEGTGLLSLGEDNLVIRAARALADETGHDPHARLHLKKQIPIAAGLAGGSADAAAALVACDQLWGPDCPGTTSPASPRPWARTSRSWSWEARRWAPAAASWSAPS
ncbi:hypothetical protein GCM10027610_129970 [Dactylosporangium cerinum]